MPLKYFTCFVLYKPHRQAIEVNRRDYRAWYGLGQTYEILKMPFYCLYYYKQAQELRPSDSRMLVALGESYEKLEKTPDAMKKSPILIKKSIATKASPYKGQMKSNLTASHH